MPKCSCKDHDAFARGKDFVIHSHRAKKIKKSTVNGLVELGHLSARATHLCTACADYYEEELRPGPSSKSQKMGWIEELIGAIERNEIDQEDLQRVAFAVGASQYLKIYEDTVENGQEYKTVDGSTSAREWLEGRNAVTLAYLRGATGVTNESSPKKCIALVRCMENLYFSRNVNFISPFSFSINLFTYSMVRSRSVCTLQSQTSPSGSYSSMVKWLQLNADTPLNEPPHTDLILFFDNNQRVGRSHRVHFNCKAQSSVMTNIIYITPQHETYHLQESQDMSPSQWLDWELKNIQENMGKVEQEEMKYQEIFRCIREEHIQESIKGVVEEQRNNGGDFTDVVDNHIQGEKVEYDGIHQGDNMHTGIQSKHPPSPPKIALANPLMLNPNSYDRVGEVLHHIETETGVGNQRKWTVVGCDGLPYSLACRIQENWYTCPICQLKLTNGESDFNDHVEQVHEGFSTDPRDHRTFKNLLIIPGHGHFEINMVKAFFKLSWSVVLSSLAKMLGFRSSKAQVYCREAKDHHKSWQILMILQSAMSRELVVPYVRTCLQCNTQPTPRGYGDWLKSVTDPNYLFIKELIFTHLLAITTFRAGVRRNNADVMLAGRLKFAPLFYSLNMTIYREIEMRDRLTRMQCPSEVQEFLKLLEGISCSGHTSAGEGGDFVLEGFNRKTKMWLPPGVPSDDKWSSICRNMTRLEKIKEGVSKEISLQLPSDPHGAKYLRNLKFEILNWRSKIRSSKYLLKPMEERQHVSMEGEALDVDLRYYTTRSTTNQDEYRKHLRTEGWMTKTGELKPIFIVPEDRARYNDINNHTKDQIAQKIEHMLRDLEDMGDIQQASDLRHELNKFKRCLKAELVQFYLEVTSIHASASLETPEDEDMEDDVPECERSSTSEHPCTPGASHS